MKTIIALFCITLSSTSFAMRCGNNLIMEGDTVNRVLDACGTPTGVNQDALTKSYDGLYYRINGMYYTLRIVNNLITRIDEDRSI